MSQSTYRKIVFYSVILTLCLLMLGAYTRLSDAGLGCPDWPGCYGQLTVPSTLENLKKAAVSHPNKPVEAAKAWAEMSHRYVAGILGLLILMLALGALLKRHSQPVLLPLLLLGVVIFQALLGMWTVTQLVYPAIVTAHLIGGMTTLGLLWLLYLKLRYPSPSLKTQKAKFAMLGIALIAIQIALGGWVSTNYSALACTAFPGCYTGQAWPSMDLLNAFNINKVEGLNYEGGVLSATIRATIHMTHRLGALLLGLFGLLLGIKYLFASGLLQKSAMIMLFLLATQITLGISNIYFSLPLPLAVLHNGCAALTLLAMISVWHFKAHPQ